MPTLTITDTLNDQYSYGPDGQLYNADNDLGGGRNNLNFSNFTSPNGYRFENVSIPQGSTIDSATLELFIDRVNKQPQLVVNGDDSDNSAAWGSGDQPADRTLTTANVTSSSFGTNGAGTSDVDAYLSIDVTTVLQEIVNRSGFSSGNSVSLIASIAANIGEYAYIRDANRTGNEPKLTYTLASAGNPTITSVNGGDPITDGDTNIAIIGTNLNAEAPTAMRIRQNGNVVAQSNAAVANSSNADFDFVRSVLLNGTATLEIVYPTLPTASFTISITSDDPTITSVNGGNPITDGDTNIPIVGTNLDSGTLTDVRLNQSGNVVSQSNGAVADGTNADFDFVRSTLTDGTVTLELVYSDKPNATIQIPIESAQASSTDIAITDTLDDGTENYNGNAITTGGGTIFVSNFGPTPAFFRFQSLAAANRAVVDSATLSFYLFKYRNAPEIRIRAVKEVNVAQINSGNLLSAKTLTTAFASFQLPGNQFDNTTVDYNQSVVIDVSALVQEVINQPAWVNGNDIAFVAQAQPVGSIAKYLYIEDFSHAGSNEPSLSVTLNPAPSISNVDTDNTFTYDQQNVQIEVVNFSALSGPLSVALDDGTNQDEQLDVQSADPYVTFDPSLLNIPLGQQVNLILSDDNGDYSIPVIVNQPAANGLVTLNNPQKSAGTIHKNAEEEPETGSIIEWTNSDEITVLPEGPIRVSYQSAYESFQVREWRQSTRTWGDWVTMSIPLGYYYSTTVVTVEANGFDSDFVSIPPTVTQSIPNIVGDQGATGSINLLDHIEGATSFSFSGQPVGSGLVFDGNNTINYNLNSADASEAYTVTVTAQNDNPTPTTTTFLVTTNAAVSFSGPIDPQVATEGEAFLLEAGAFFASAETFALEFFDSSAGSWGAAPYVTAFVIDSNTGDITGTPNSADIENDPNVRVVASNSIPTSITSNSFQIVVNEVLSRPIIDDIPNQVFNQGQEYTVDLSSYVTNPLTDNETYTLSGLPQNTGISIDSNTGVMSVNATVDDYNASQIAVTLIVENGDGTTTESFLCIILLPSSSAVSIFDPDVQVVKKYGSPYQETINAGGDHWIQLSFYNKGNLVDLSAVTKIQIDFTDADGNVESMNSTDDSSLFQLNVDTGVINARVSHESLEEGKKYWMDVIYFDSQNARGVLFTKNRSILCEVV